jgi:exopolyphosphatase / guanosine-5'-triphosphate,3'-diphosphate pyrophosphatase
MEGDSHRVAVVDIGSNSTRLLVADIGAGGMSEIERESRVTRLGRGVDLTGQLSVEAVEAACEAIADYVAICRECDVEQIEAIATSAVRDASNGEAFVAELRERFALSARVLGGEEEARLTYMGATFEDPPAEPTLVIDIGGGSTELVVGTGREIAFHASMQAGVVRHTERHVTSDPPTPNELEALAGDVRALIEAAIGDDPAATATAAIAVAGTPTSLASIELGLEPYDPRQVHGRTLDLVSIQRLLSQLASAPLAKRAEFRGLHPDRAPSIVAGVVILVETMRAFDLERITVSEHDILYGVAIEAVSALECG